MTQNRLVRPTGLYIHLCKHGIVFRTIGIVFPTLLVPLRFVNVEEYNYSSIKPGLVYLKFSIHNW